MHTSRVRAVRRGSAGGRQIRAQAAARIFAYLGDLTEPRHQLPNSGKSRRLARLRPAFHVVSATTIMFPMRIVLPGAISPKVDYHFEHRGWQLWVGFL